MGCGLTVLVAAVWQAYLHVSKKPTETKPPLSVSVQDVANTGDMTATATNGGMVTNVIGNNNNVGVPPALVHQIVLALTQRLPPNSQANYTKIKALIEAVTALSEGRGFIGTNEKIKNALFILIPFFLSQLWKFTHVVR